MEGAFLNGKLEEEIYMKTLEGYAIEHEMSIDEFLELNQFVV